MSIRKIPSGFEFWPKRKQAWSPAETVRLYETGFAGAWQDEAAHETFRSDLIAAGGQPDASDVLATNNIAQIGKKGLWLLFPSIERLFPNALPGPAQQRGDCVVHCSRNVALASLCSEIDSLRPDEVSGKL